MMATQVVVTDRATPVVVAIGKAVNSAEMRHVIGGAVVRVFKRHLSAVNTARPNVLGGDRTNFYKTAGDGTHYDLLPDGVLISVGAGLPDGAFRQRVLGGTIRAKRSKYLTIPARAEAHGHKASEFHDLVVVFGRGGQPVALARSVQTSLRVTGAATAAVLGVSRLSRGEVTGGEIMFWLKKEVTQRGDPSVAPQMLDIAAGAFSAANSHLDRVAAKARAAVVQKAGSTP
jgi:hypothetical protein